MASESETKPRPTHAHSGSSGGILWFAGWMFTIVFARLIWWKVLLAFIIWPWYLALAVR